MSKTSEAEDPIKAPSDFNDKAALHGPEAVKKAIEQAIKPKPKRSGSSQFSQGPKGVFFHASDREGNDLPPEWLCSPLRVLAMTRDRHSEEWGRLLSWEDPDGNAHRRALPASMLIGDGRDLAKVLADGGLRLSARPGSLQRLLAYVVTESPGMRARCVSTPGWHDGQYVLPTGEAVGAAADASELVYQNTGGLSLAYEEAGDWRAVVAPLCRDNSRLIMAVCATLAGPMLRLAGSGGGGFNFVGDSSTGKSTLLRVAASVAGSPDLVREWRATTNGLEGLAVAHNDATMILDELAQIDPRDAGPAAYMLANGSGKSRSNRSGDARPAMQWLTLMLSAGEIGLAQHMASAGQRARAGQALRLADVAADAGKGFGAFDAIADCDGPAAFSALVKEMTAANYGGIWRPWIKALAGMDRAEVRRAVRREESKLKRRLPGQADGQVHRVLDRFALLAAAGELASAAGLTGWPDGHASWAVAECVRAYLSIRGGLGNSDAQALLSQVRAFLETHGSSRFESLRAKDFGERPIANRAGYVRDNHLGQRQYLVWPETFKRELCEGYDVRSASQWLRAAGWLEPDAESRSTQKIRVPNVANSVRLYVIDADAVHGAA